MQDIRLRKAIEGSKERPDWHQLAKNMGRSVDDVEARWKHVLNPRAVKGPWTPEVSAAKDGVAVWCPCAPSPRSGRGGPLRDGRERAGFRPGRAPLAICLTPLPSPPTCAQEDAEVIRLVGIYGAKKWSLIADHLEGRVGKQCRER